MVSLLAAKTATSNITMGANVDDVSLYWDIREIIYKHFNELKAAHVEVTVFNRVAILVGFLPTQADKDNLDQALERLPDLEKYYDYVQVDAHPPKVSYLHDSLITSKLKVNLFSEVNPMHYKILTYNRQVFLLGRCHLPDCQMALYIAQHTAGVKSVVDALSIIPLKKTDAPILSINLNPANADNTRIAAQ